MSEGLKVAELFAALSIKPEGKSFDAADKLLETVHRGLEALVGYEAIEKLHGLFDSVEETAVGAVRLAQKLGISTDAVQELGYAADVTGASAGELQIGIQHLALGFDEARKGTGNTASALQSLGLHFDALKNQSPDAILAEIADRFAAMPDGVAKTSAAMELFGRSGTSLIPMLDKGRDGIAGLRQEARDLGVVIGGDTVEKFEELEHTQKRLGAAWDGAKNQLAEALLPTILEITEGVVGWIKAHRQLISSGIQTFAHVLGVAFRVVATVIGAVVKAIEFLGAHRQILYAIGAALAIMFGPAAIAAIAAWGAALVTAFAPFLLTVGVIAAIAYAVQRLWEKFEDGETIGQIWDDIVDGIKTAWDTGLSAMEKRWDEFQDYLKGIKRKAAEALFGPGSQLDKLVKAANFAASDMNASNFHVTDQERAGYAAEQAKHFKLPWDHSGDYLGGSPYGIFNRAPDPGAKYVLNEPGNPFGGGMVVNAPVTINMGAGDPAAVGKAVQDALHGALQDAHAATGGRGAPQ